MKRTILFAAGLASWVPALAAPATYTIDPTHTCPSFEADHMGISTWRGKMNGSAGTIVFDKATGKGSVDVAKHTRATYKGESSGLLPDAMPAQATGELALHGVTRLVILRIRSFKCIEHPLLERDYCDADATASFKRNEFDLGAGKDYGFDMDVKLRIQVEALLDASGADDVKQ